MKLEKNGICPTCLGNLDDGDCNNENCNSSKTDKESDEDKNNDEINTT